MSLREYVSESLKKRNDTIAFMFGRFNPPTKGHIENIDAMMKWCKDHNADNLIVPTKTQKPKTDPLSFAEKAKFLRKSTEDSVNIDSWNMNNIFKLLDKFTTLGYKKVVLFVGADRVKEFQELFAKYVVAPEYTFRIEVIDSGKRTKGVSGSDQRHFASENDFESFSKNCPELLSIEDRRKLFDLVRQRLGK